MIKKIIGVLLLLILAVKIYGSQDQVTGMIRIQPIVDKTSERQTELLGGQLIQQDSEKQQMYINIVQKALEAGNTPAMRQAFVDIVKSILNVFVVQMKELSKNLYPAEKDALKPLIISAISVLEGRLKNGSVEANLLLEFVNRWEPFQQAIQQVNSDTNASKKFIIQENEIKQYLIEALKQSINRLKNEWLASLSYTVNAPPSNPLLKPGLEKGSLLKPIIKIGASGQ